MIRHIIQNTLTVFVQNRERKNIAKHVLTLIDTCVIIQSERTRNKQTKAQSKAVQFAKVP